MQYIQEGFLDDIISKVKGIGGRKTEDLPKGTGAAPSGMSHGSTSIPGVGKSHTGTPTLSHNRETSPEVQKDYEQRRKKALNVTNIYKKGPALLNAVKFIQQKSPVAMERLVTIIDGLLDTTTDKLAFEGLGMELGGIEEGMIPFSVGQQGSPRMQRQNTDKKEFGDGSEKADFQYARALINRVMPSLKEFASYDPKGFRAFADQVKGLYNVGRDIKNRVLDVKRQSEWYKNPQRLDEKLAGLVAGGEEPIGMPEAMKAACEAIKADDPLLYEAVIIGWNRLQK